MIYTLNGVVTVSAYTKVEADTLEEAIEIAKDRAAEWHQHTPYEETVFEEWIVSEIDGEVMKIHNETE